jgi:zinc/manganese transport system substrate-binding protein/manganese/iron transport system substrate-binding protein
LTLRLISLIDTSYHYQSTKAQGMPISRRVRVRAARLTWLLLVGALLLAACGSHASASSEVVTTTVQIGALTRAVAGDAIEVHTLIAPGVDPHEYDATTDDLKRLSASKLVLRNGLGLDNFLDKAIENSGAGTVVTVTGGIELRYPDGPGHDPDPHVWQDPLNDKVMVDNIVRALSDAFREQAATFRANGDAYKAKLDTTDAQIRGLIDSIPPANRKMVTDHDAFGYFIDRYGLTYVGAVIPGTTTQGEPSSKDVAQLEDTIRHEGVRAIFAESSVAPKVAHQIAADTGVRIVDDLYGDTLGEPGSGADTVDGMLLTNARKIVEALK